MCFFLLRLRSLLLIGSSAGYLLKELKRIYVTVSKTPKKLRDKKIYKTAKKIQWSLFDDNKNITKMRNCPEVPICNTLFVHGESHGLGLYLMVVHGVSHVVGHRASLETGLGVPHGVGHDRFIKCQEV